MDSTTRLGPYEIKGFLTDVGLDDLYLGNDTDRDAEIVLRLLSVFLHEEDTIDRLRERARRIRAIGNVHLLALSSVEKYDGPVLAVAERAPGRALDYFVPAAGLPVDDALKACLALASGVAALHRETLVHGYLHAGRVVVADNGELKLLVIGPEEATTGPPPRVAACQAPEVCDGAEVDARAEVFALGALLYRILTGEAPFSGKTTLAIQASIRQDAAPRVADKRADLPDGLARVVRRCLEKDRAWRYENADEVYGELLEIAGTRNGRTDHPPLPEAAVRLAPSSGLGLPNDPEPRLRLVGGSDGAWPVEPEGHVAPAPEPAAGAQPGLGPQSESIADPEEATDQEPDVAPDTAPEAEPEVEAADAQEPRSRSAAHRPPLSAARDKEPGAWRLPAAGVALLLGGVAVGWLLSGWAIGNEPVPSVLSLQRATSAAGPELFPQLSPDGTALYYAAAAGGDWGVYAYDLDSENAVELTADSRFGDSQPALSPDGSLIAFRSERDGGGIFVMTSEGLSVRKLADSGHNPSWSPDGTEIAIATSPVYDAPYPGATSEIVVIDAISGAQRAIVGASGMQPHWSPDGGRIAYWSSRGAGATDIWTIPVGGGEPVAVTDDPTTDWNPVWSPSGAHLYFVSNRGGSQNIWRVAIDSGSGSTSGEAQPVTTAGGVRTLHPSFARSSGTMVYAEATERRNLYRIPFDAAAGTTTGAPELLPGIPVDASAPDVAADAGRIAFLLPAGDGQQVWISDLDGGDTVPMTDRAARALHPRLSPDGRNVAFLSDQGGSLQLWTAPVGGGPAQRHTELTTRKISQPTWSRDGRGIGMSVGGAMMPSYTLLFDPQQNAEQQVADTLLSTPSDATFEPHSWSRDGARIAGSIRRGDGRLAGIAVLPVGGDEHEMVTEFGMNPVWLRDSRRLLFQSGASLYLVDSRTPEPVAVFSSVPDALGDVFSVSSDDRWIYVSLERKEADAWLLNR